MRIFSKLSRERFQIICYMLLTTRVKNKKKAIFFDRDGVLIDAPIINGKPHSTQILKDIKLCKYIVKICNFYMPKSLVINSIYFRFIITKKN